MPDRSDRDHRRQRIAQLEAELAKLRSELPDGAASAAASGASTSAEAIRVSDIDIRWRSKRGVCTFADLPVAMMWVDTTLAGLMSGVHSMVGTERFQLALQSEGRKSVEADWQVISQHTDFAAGFEAIANIAAVAGWGRWHLVSLDEAQRRAEFHVTDSWEGGYQKTLGVHWGSAMLAGKLAGYCTKLFGTNCWADQIRAIHQGDDHDAFVVAPSDRSIEAELEGLLASDEATRADMAVALNKLSQEIAERRQAERALKVAHDTLEQRVEERTVELAAALRSQHESEQSFRATVEYSPMGILIWKLDERDQLTLIASNAATDRIVGLSAEQFIGKRFEEVLPGLASDPLATLMRNIARDGGTFAAEQYAIEDDNASGIFDFHLYQPRPNQVAALFLDVSERVKELQQKEALQQQLHRSRQMESLGLLAGGVAHDLNNILSGLVTYPSLLLMDLTPDDPMYSNLQTIEDTGVRAAAVVRDLLTITRASATELAAVDLNQLVRDYLRSPEHRLCERAHPAVAVTAAVQDSQLILRGSLVHLRKALMNLVTNAMEACRGRGEVAIRTESRYVDAPLAGYDRVDVGDYVVLTVQDTGAGIPADDLERIFEPFYSRKVLDRSGTGLGLTVVWNTVQQHDGYIQVTSSAEGTSFEIYLHASQEPILEEAAQVKNTALRGQGERVLVIDDEPRQRELASRILQSLGYQARAVESGEAALAALAETPAELLLLDMIMPDGWSGKLTYLRIVEAHPGQRAVIASGFAKTDDVREIQRAGAGPFLRKPYSVAQLSLAVREELDRK